MFEIKKAGIAETELLCKLGAQTFTDAYAANNTKEDLEAYNKKSFAPEVILAELNEINTEYYLCFDGPLAIGYLKLNFDKACEAFESDQTTELQRIYVLKEYYQHKAGMKLMQYAIEICTARHNKYLWLGVWKENYRALKFYQAWGFETIGERSFKVGSKLYEDYYLRKKL